MANPDRRLAGWRSTSMAFVIQAAICSSLAAETTPATIVDQRSTKQPFEQIALAPAAETSLELKVRTGGHVFRNSLAEARAVLEELRLFADTARNAIGMGRNITALRRTNNDLRRNLDDYLATRHDLENDLAKVEAKSALLTGIILEQWLLSEQMRRDKAEQNQRLALAKSAWISTTKRLNLLKHKLAEQREKAGILRARTAALAAEIGRTRRAAINLEKDAKAFDADRQAANAKVRRLRHGTSTGLRTILLSP